MRRLWPTRRALAPPDFLKLWSAETISQFGSQVAELALPLVAILVLDASAFEVAALGTVEFLPVHPLHAAGRRLGRPAAAAADPDRRRLRPGGAPRDDPDRVRRRRADARAALRRRLPRRASAPSSSTSRTSRTFPSLVERDQLIEGNSKLEISRSAAQVGGPGFARRARGDLHRAVRGPRRRDQLPRLGLFMLGIRKRGGTPGGRAADGSKVEPLDRAQGGPPLRAREPEPARPGGLHRDVEPLLERRVRDPPRLRGPRARAVRGR